MPATTPPTGGTILLAPTVTDQTVRLWPVFRAGLLVDLLNPKTVIFFLALLPQFVPGGALTASTAAVMVICVVGLGLLFDGGYAALAGGLQRRRSDRPRAMGSVRWPVAASWPWRPSRSWAEDASTRPSACPGACADQPRR